MNARVAQCLAQCLAPKLAPGLAFGLALVGSASSGCGDPCADPEAVPAIELGLGEETFAAITEGAVVTPGSGAQGGQHVWGAIRVVDLVTTAPPGESGALTVELGVDHADGPVATYGPAAVRLAPGKDALVGLTAQITADPYSAPWLFPDDFDPSTADSDAYEAAGSYRDAALAQGLTYWASVSDRCGTELTDSRTIGLTDVWRMY